MSQPSKAVLYQTASGGTTFFQYPAPTDILTAIANNTGSTSDTNATNQWTQITQNNGLLLDLATVATSAWEFTSGVTFDANGRYFPSAAALLAAAGTYLAGAQPIGVVTGATGNKAIPYPVAPHARLTVRITKSTAATDLTIANAIAGTNDGMEITAIDETGHAHVITNASTGFNNKGSSGTITFGGTIGSRVTIYPDNGQLWAQGSGVTIA